MPKKIVILAVGFVLIIFVLVGVYAVVSKKNIVQLAQSTSVSSNILYITNPVTSFSGKIESVQGNTVTVSQDMVIAQMFTPPAAGQPNQLPAAPVTPKTKKITYKVLITNNTMINQAPSFIPYLFKQTATPGAGAPMAAAPIAAINKLAAKDLKTGQFINISTNTDLRSLSGDQFEATSINLSSKATSVNGRVTAINGGELVIKGFAPTSPMGAAAVNPQTPKEKEYTITVNQDTEISGNASSNDPMKPPKPEKYSLSDLKKDTQITVYTEDDIDLSTKLTALKIEPFFPNLAITTPNTPPQSSPAGSLTPK